jgi:Asp-tRNA(Asn)/Glu-tRNA(Gln) amidotransferase C subunit
MSELITYTKITQKIDFEGIEIDATLYKVKDRCFGEKEKAIMYTNELRKDASKVKYQEKKIKAINMICKQIAAFEIQYDYNAQELPFDFRGTIEIYKIGIKKEQAEQRARREASYNQHKVKQNA